MFLALQIYQAVAQVEGVTGQEVEVVGYVGAEELTALLRNLGPAVANMGADAGTAPSKGPEKG